MTIARLKLVSASSNSSGGELEAILNGEDTVAVVFEGGDEVVSVVLIC